MMEKIKQGDFHVSRSLQLPGIAAEMLADVLPYLQALPGMDGVAMDPSRHRLLLHYDASQLGFAQIEQALREAGWPLPDGRWARMRHAWYRYLDENAQANAAAKGGACCSNPSDVYARRQR